MSSAIPVQLANHSPQFKYMNSHIFTVFFTFYRYVTNSKSGQLPVAGLIAQLIEHCTGIAEVIGSNPIQT